MPHPVSIAFCAAALFALACAPDREPAVELCTDVLTRRFPEARVVEATSDASDAAVAFELGDRWKALPGGRLECHFDEVGSGGAIRLRAATLDGVAFTTAELTVINADLLLADLRRADRANRDRDERR
ncbi:MAG: hypothetical protein H6Q91_1871 [Deltaproteobacteria bacterium]|nr:hypothetical protein [Deltaproteobacteria bacterium]